MLKSIEKGGMVHATVIYRYCDVNRLNDASHLACLLRKAAAISRMKILGEQFHEFDPMGFTGVLLLSESHIAIHSWPEHRLAVLTFFACGGKDPNKAIQLVRRGLGSKDIQVHMAPISDMLSSSGSSN